MKNEIERKVEEIFSPAVKQEEADVAMSEYMASVASSDRCASLLTDGQRAESEKQPREAAEPTYLSDAWAKEHGRTKLKTVGVNLEGLLNYYVDKDGITIEADCVLIEADQISELLMELELVACKHREMREADA